MKRYVVIAFLLIGSFFVASGEESSTAVQSPSTNAVSSAVSNSVPNPTPYMTPNELERLRKKLSGTVVLRDVTRSTVSDDQDKKFELVKFNTYQDKRDIVDLTMRVTIELADKDGQTCFAQLSHNQGSRDTEYTGEDGWEFRIPHGELEDAKLSAYVIDYGILQDGVLTTVAKKLYKVKSVDEITTRVSCRNVTGKALHYYWYEDGDGNPVSSNPN
jgi:hypothetical protein